MGTVYVSGECRAPKDELRQLILSGGIWAPLSSIFLRTKIKWLTVWDSICYHFPMLPRWFCGKHCPCGFCGCWRVQRPWRKPVSMHLYLRSVKPQRAFIFNCGLLQVHWLCHREVGAWFCAIPCGKKEFNIVSIFNPDWLEYIASLKEKVIAHPYFSALQVMPFSDYPL